MVGGYTITLSFDNFKVTYCHCDPNFIVNVGDFVKQGQVIGYVGNTGNCQPRPTPSNPYAGTHLHFSVFLWPSGTVVNPFNYLP